MKLAISKLNIINCICLKMSNTRENTIVRKQFQCSCCIKSFTHRSNILKHQTIHTGEKPFQCSYCNKRFKLKLHLVNHQKIHVQDKPLQFGHYVIIVTIYLLTYLILWTTHCFLCNILGKWNLA